MPKGPKTSDAAVPIFVMGSPRSGTTLISAFLGTCSDVINFQELSIFYFSHWVARHEYARTPTPLKDAYLHELDQHAIDFALRKARDSGKRFFCDSAPWNLYVADYLAGAFPNAVFVLVLRHYAGVIQSLERSHRDGWSWAGADVRERARLWSELYVNARELPPGRTVPLSYDRLCAEPSITLMQFCASLTTFGIPAEEGSLASLSHSHATTEVRPTVAQLVGDTIVLRPIPSFDAGRWSKSISRQVEDIVGDTDSLLKNLFPDHYSSPRVGWLR